MIFVLAIAACSPQQSGLQVDWVARDDVPTIDPNTDPILHTAQANYNIYCAHCHGYAGEGHNPSSEKIAKDLGYAIVPAHDASGHTWEHPDQLLFEVIKYGIENPLNLYPMAEYGSRMSDDEIMGVIDYMKRWWTADQRAHQARLTEAWAEREAGQ